MREYVPMKIVDDDDDYWEAWYALPLHWRRWLLWYVPGWWALPVGVFRRVLLRTAALIVWHGVPPRTALRHVAARLRLPPPRPTRRMPATAPRAALRPRYRAPARAPWRAPVRTAVRRPPRARPRFAPRLSRGGVRGRFR